MTRHIHECKCGAFMVCHQEPDRCPIRHWDCPICEDKALDDYFAAQVADLAREPQEALK